jgi:AcrR family transcriptional regulator
MCFMTASQVASTRERLLGAAADLFAERGFRGATLRDIADRAGANLASAHYYFGSKEALYLEVAFAQFVFLEQELARRGADRSDAQLGRLSRDELAALLRARLEILLETLLESPEHWGALMMRELADPTEALAQIVRRFIKPMRDAFGAIVARLAPSLAPEAVQRCVHSIVGQALFYRTHRPALLLLAGAPAYPGGFSEDAARHIAEFSLGGIERLEAAAQEQGRGH